MPANTIPLHDLLTLVIAEGKRRVLTLTAIFAVLALTALIVGLRMPKRWESSTLIVSQGKDIIKQLLEGRAVPTTNTDQTQVVTQVIGSRPILREIAAFGGWPQKGMSPADEERLLKHIKEHIKIETAKEDTAIRISYSDTDQRRAYLVTTKLAEIFIRETSAAKETQSRDAFEFISRRVKEYADKMSDAHAKVLAYYRGEESHVRPAVVVNVKPVAGGSDDGRSRSHIPVEELDALRSEEATLKAQLGRKPPAVAGAAESHLGEDQLRARVATTQAELDRLRERFTEQHPDVRHAERELETAKAELAKTEQARLSREKAVAAAAALDDEMSRAAAARLDVVQQKIAAATGAPRPRPNSPHITVPLPDSPNDIEMRSVGQDTVLSELLRRYEATRDVYQDLLKRQENARVSMDLDAEHRGLTVEVKEAAELPVVPTGTRLRDVALAGLVLAMAAPVGLLFALVKVDPRIRSPHQIEMARLPLLVAIPGAAAPNEKARRRRHNTIATAIVLGVFVLYAAILIMKMRSP